MRMHTPNKWNQISAIIDQRRKREVASTLHHSRPTDQPNKFVITGKPWSKPSQSVAGNVGGIRRTTVCQDR
jgi:hypothetical protein